MCRNGHRELLERVGRAPEERGVGRVEEGSTGRRRRAYDEVLHRLRLVLVPQFFRVRLRCFLPLAIYQDMMHSPTPQPRPREPLASLPCRPPRCQSSA